MRINKREIPIRQEKQMEDLRAKAEDQQATIDYLSMMSGIDIPQTETADEPTGVEADE